MLHQRSASPHPDQSRLEECERSLLDAKAAVEKTLLILRELSGRSSPALLSEADLTELLMMPHVQIAGRAGTHDHRCAVLAAQLQLDTSNGVARLGRRKVPLTDTEFEVLHVLWKRQSEVVSRVDLIDILYQGRPKPGLRSVDVFIFHLRQKLRIVSGGLEFIWAVRGKGWQLRLPVAEQGD